MLGGCTPVGCVLLQLLQYWNASVTATCYKRALPVVKALGATEYICLTELLINTEKIDVNEEDSNFIINELEKRGSIFDIIFNTNLNSDCVTKLSKFLDSGHIISTVPAKLASDSYGILTRYFLYWYIWLKYKLQVSF